MKKFHIITLFPEVCEPYTNTSIIGRAQEKKYIKILYYNLRQWGEGKHRKVDDIPYGGGPGMVLKVQPIYTALQSIYKKIGNKAGKKRATRTILMSTRGTLFDNKVAKRLSRYDDIVIICGRYEGVDERVAKHLVDEEISMGDFVLSGGELPALSIVDAVSRQIAGVLGTYESLEEIKGSFPTYTRPEDFFPDKKNKRKKWSVPKVLVSGNHAHIEAWRGGEKIDKK